MPAPMSPQKRAEIYRLLEEGLLTHEQIARKVRVSKKSVQRRRAELEQMDNAGWSTTGQPDGIDQSSTRAPTAKTNLERTAVGTSQPRAVVQQPAPGEPRPVEPTAAADETRVQGSDAPVEVVVAVPMLTMEAHLAIVATMKANFATAAAQDRAAAKDVAMGWRAEADRQSERAQRAEVAFVWTGQALVSELNARYQAEAERDEAGQGERDALVELIDTHQRLAATQETLRIVASQGEAREQALAAVRALLDHEPTVDRATGLLEAWNGLSEPNQENLLARIDLEVAARIEPFRQRAAELDNALRSSPGLLVERESFAELTRDRSVFRETVKRVKVTVGRPGYVFTSAQVEWAALEQDCHALDDEITAREEAEQKARAERDADAEAERVRLAAEDAGASVFIGELMDRAKEPLVALANVHAAYRSLTSRQRNIVTDWCSTYIEQSLDTWESMLTARERAFAPSATEPMFGAEAESAFGIRMLLPESRNPVWDERRARCKSRQQALDEQFRTSEERRVRREAAQAQSEQKLRDWQDAQFARAADPANPHAARDAVIAATPSIARLIVGLLAQSPPR